MANEFIARNGITSLGNIVVSGSITSTGAITISGSIASSSFSSTASSADNFLTRGTLTAQTLVVQTITSSVDFVTGSTRFGSLSANTHTFTGSILASGSATVVGTMTATKGVFGTSGTGTFGIHITDNDQSNVRLRLTNSGTGGQAFSIVGGNPGASNSGLAIYDETNAATRMYISSSGNVGIGTISPTSLLEVQANQNAQTGIRVRNSTSGTSAQVEFGVYTNSGNGGFGKYSTGTTPYKNIIAASTYVYNGSSGDIALLNDVAAGNISFAAGGASSAQLFVSASGFVGIGTTSPIGPLTIAVPAVGSAIGAANSQQAYDYSRLRIKHYSDSNLGLSIGYAGANQTYIQTGYNEGSVAPLSLNPFGGNIGIGVTSPSDVLDVRKNQNGITNFYLQNTDTTNTNSRAYLNVVSGNTTLLIASIHSDNTYVKPLTATGLYLGYDNFLKLTGGANMEYNVVPNGYYHFATDNAKISVASGGTLNFGTFSGFIMVNNHSNGYVGIFLCGAGTTSLVSYTGSTSGLGTLAYNGGINGYTWTSNHGATAFYGFFVIKTRANA